MNNALVRFGIQLWRLAHEDLMVFVREEGRVWLWGLEWGHGWLESWQDLERRQLVLEWYTGRYSTKDTEIEDVMNRCESVVEQTLKDRKACR